MLPGIENKEEPQKPKVVYERVDEVVYDGTGRAVKQSYYQRDLDIPTREVISTDQFDQMKARGEAEEA